MRTPVKLAAFGGALALAFAGALGVGTAVGKPVAPTSDSAPGVHGGDHAATGAAAGGAAGVSAAAGDQPGGLMVSENGYTLDLAQDALPAGPGAPLSFRILGADGAPVTAYQASHDEDLHLVAVRRDMTGFQHVHPTLSSDGTWSVPLDLSAGDWRIFADFVPDQGRAAGQTLVLGADLAVAGDFQPTALPAPSTTAEVDGYTVTLDGQLVPGEESALTLSVSRDGAPVTDLQPYLAAYGHLVALRAGDLAYLHVHPVGEPGDGTTQSGPDITFYATAPSTGDYRLYLDFQHDGVVRTAAFTARADGTVSAVVPPTAEQPTRQPVDEHSSDGHAH